MPDLAKWRQTQIRAAVARGVSPLDASQAAKVALALMPPGADPDAYLASDWMLVQDLSNRAYRDDANVAWFARGGRFATLLDAGEVTR